MVKLLVAVGLGGALGAMARFGLALWLNQDRWELSWGTLVANLVGSLMMGLLLAWDHARALPEAWRLFWVVGYTGALTTFSSFAAETLLLTMRDKFGLALLTIAAHLIGSLVMVSCGYALMRRCLSS